VCAHAWLHQFTAPPRSIIADSPTPTSVDLNWQAPACLDTNGDITEYEYELIGVDDWATQEKQTASIRDTKVNVCRGIVILLL
jgi:hypothetical protein